MDEAYFDRLIYCKNTQDISDVLKRYIGAMYLTLRSSHDQNTCSEIDRDAETIAQMVWSKLIHIKRIIDTTCADSRSGLDTVIDSSIIGCLARNLFEMTATFHMIYRSTKGHDQKKLAYDLWRCSCLEYRQKFAALGTSEESKEKLQREENDLKEIKEGIESNPYYQGLDQKSKYSIRGAIKNKKYLISWDGSPLKTIGWQECAAVMGIKKDLFTEMYNYFSQYAHPTYTSVFQFRDFFDNSAWLDLISMHMKYIFGFTSMFIADYRAVFSGPQTAYGGLDEMNREIIDYYNQLFLVNNI